MKKTSLLLALTIMLTGCTADKTSSDNGGGAPQTGSSVLIDSQSSSGNSTSNDTEPTTPSNTDSTEENKYEQIFKDGYFVDLTSENAWLKDAFMERAKELDVKLVNPDGTDFDPSDAVRAAGDNEGVNALSFNYAYILYSKPYFYSSIDTPELNSIDKLFGDFKAKSSMHEPSDFIKVSAGDVLDNGLKIKTATYTQDLSMGEFEVNYANTMSVALEGELTLEGVIVKGTLIEIDSTDYYCFYPDANKQSIPEIDPHMDWYGDADNGVYIVGDAPKIMFRNNESPEIISAIDEALNGKRCAKATVVIKDPSYHYSRGGPYFNCSAALVSIEGGDA